MGAYDFNCAHCGKSGAGRPTGGSTLAPSGWVWNKSFGFGRKAFCSNKCLNEYNGSNSSSKGEDNAENNAENNAELARLEWEKEQEKKKEEALKQAKLDQKADVFRSQGKHFCALITEHLKKIQMGVLGGFGISLFLLQSNPPLGLLLLIIVLGLVIFGSIKYWKELKS